MVLYKLKDITGNPTTTTRKSPFHLMFESTGFDSDLYHYMFSPNASFSGELIFYDRDEFKTLYKVEFHKAYIVGLTEEFDNQDNLPLHINLAITCGAVKIKDVKKIENWVFEDPFIEVEPTVLEREQEIEKTPRILKKEWRDEEGNTIKESEIGSNSQLFLKVKDIAEDEELIIVLEDADDDPTNNIELKGIVNKNGEVLLNR